MAKNFRRELVGVFGYPVDENPTVVIQDAAFEAKGLFWRYLTLLVKPEDLGGAMQSLRALNFKGINLTIPHKMACMAYLDEVDKSASLIGAVNTVRNDGGVLIGYNTDGQGFVRALDEAGVALQGATVALLGAGGAGRAIAVEAALAGAKKMVIFNRNAARGQALATLVSASTGCEAVYAGWEGSVRIPADADVLVNATSVGLYPDTRLPDVDMVGVSDKLVVCDVIPNPPQTPFLREAAKRGARKLITGEGMLVHQGAIGFEIWTGEKAPADVMLEALRRAFSEE
jgi:shikimate dehydrogenase